MEERSRKLRLVQGRVLVVGVDVAKRKHVARFLNSRGEDIAKPLLFENSREGFCRLGALLARLKAENGLERVVVGMEPTGHYWKPLAWFLRGRGDMVVMVNPYHVKRTKELDDNSQMKNDRKDAGLIAQLVKEGRFLHCLLPTGVYGELRELTVARQQQKRKLNAVLCQLRAVLDEYFPEFEQVFKNTIGLGARWVLANFPFPGDIQSVPAADLAQGLKAATSHRVGLKRAQKLRQVAEESIGVEEGTAGVRVRLRGYLAEVDLWLAQLKETEKAMANALRTTGWGEILTGVPGVGVVTAAGFLGEIGDPTAFSNWRQVQKLAGLNLVEQSSGEKRGQRTISKRGRPGLRALLYQAAVTAVAKDPVFGSLYRYFLGRAQNPLEKKQALIAVALKLLRVMLWLVQSRQFYDPTKALGFYREKQLRAAA